MIQNMTDQAYLMGKSNDLTRVETALRVFTKEKVSEQSCDGTLGLSRPIITFRKLTKQRGRCGDFLDTIGVHPKLDERRRFPISPQTPRRIDQIKGGNAPFLLTAQHGAWNVAAIDDG